MVIYLFNPENDLAVAVGSPHYTPPPNAQRIASDLSLLPLWYTHDGDIVVSSQSVPSQFARFFPNRIVTSNVTGNIVCEDGVFLVPWGWSRYTKTKYKEAGVPLSLLPTEAQLDQVRKLSHREITIQILQELQDRGVAIVTLPVLLHTPQQVQQFIEGKYGRLLKAPWSGSGKGLYWGRGEYDTPLARWSNGILKRQHLLLGEDVLDKTLDFAMEFLSDTSGVRFAGYSIFTTDAKGVYKGNMLMSDDDIEQKITQYISSDDLHFVKKELESILQDKIGDSYHGYFGIDMLVAKDDNGQYLLQPCIEMNLRMNMGMLSRLLYDRWVHPDSTGYYYIDFEKEENRLLQDHVQREKEMPLRIENGKIKSGYLSLCPVAESTQYRARIEIEEKII